MATSLVDYKVSGFQLPKGAWILERDFFLVWRHCSALRIFCRRVHRMYACWWALDDGTGFCVCLSQEPVGKQIKEPHSERCSAWFTKSVSKRIQTPECEHLTNTDVKYNIWICFLFILHFHHWEDPTTTCSGPQSISIYADLCVATSICLSALKTVLILRGPATICDG